MMTNEDLVSRYPDPCWNNYQDVPVELRQAVAKAHIAAAEATHKAAKGKHHFQPGETRTCPGCSICTPVVTAANLEWTTSSTGKTVAFIRFTGHNNSRGMRFATTAEVEAAK